jgi:hypothetical protein
LPLASCLLPLASCLSPFALVRARPLPLHTLNLFYRCSTDVQVNTLGCIFGVIAVVATTLFQIWTGTYQGEFQLKGSQVVLPLATCLLPLALCPSSFLSCLACFDPPLLTVILLRCCSHFTVHCSSLTRWPLWRLCSSVSWRSCSNSSACSAGRQSSTTSSSKWRSCSS